MLNPNSPTATRVMKACVHLWVVSWLLPLFIGSCRASGEPTRSIIPEATVQKDSGGIRVVEYHVGPPGEHVTGTWALATRPTLTVGVAVGDTAHELYRVKSAFLLGDGRLVVGVGGAYQFRIFDSTGALVRSVGRRGVGPSEFRSLTHLWLLDHDRIGAYDIRLKRVSVFDSSGVLLRSTSFNPIAPSDSAMLVTDAFGFAARGLMIAYAERLWDGRGGLERDSIEIVNVDSVGRVRHVLGPLTGSESYSVIEGGSAELATPPFGRNRLVAAGPGLIATADNTRYQVTTMTPSGTLSMILRVDVAPERMTDEDILGAAREANGARGEDVDDKLLAMMRDMSPHEYLPVLSAMHVDRSNELWVEEFARPANATRRVTGFARDGKLLGSFELPRQMDLLSVDTSRVVVLLKDPTDGHESVKVFPLLRHP